MEGQNAIKYNKSIPLSVEQLVDCSEAYGNFGCGGGYVNKAFEYIKSEGISTEDSYPYELGKDTCHSGVDSGVKVASYVGLPIGENYLKDAVGKTTNRNFLNSLLHVR